MTPPHAGASIPEELLAPIVEGLDRACFFAERVLGDRALAEDAVQEACARYVRRPPEDRGRQALAACFMRMVYQSAVDILRSERARRAREEAQPVSAGSILENPERAAIAAEAAQAARRALGGLPRAQREAVCLCCEEGFTQREAAEILGEPLGTVADRVRRGLGELRKKLTAAGFTGLALPALGEALGRLQMPPAPAHVAQSVHAIATGSKAIAAGAAGGATAAAVKGGLTLKIIAGLVCAGAVAMSVAAISDKGASSPSAGGGDWRDERWIVEPFTAAMGGGPEWGPAACVGRNLQYMVQDKDGNFFLNVAATSGAASQRIDIITPDGVRWPLAGTGGPGFQDGPAAEAQFKLGVGSYYGFTNVSVDDRGNVFVGDNGNGRVRRIFKDANEKWTVETYAGGGGKELGAGAACAPREAKLPHGTMMVAAAPDGTVYVGTVSRAYLIDKDAKSIKRLGPWPDSISRKGAKGNRMNLCGAGCDKNGVAYFASRTTDVVCRVTPNGKIEHIAGATILKRDAESSKTGDRAPPLLANFDTPSSMFVDHSGEVIYMCGGDEYDVRRVPTDMKTTTATLLQNGRWYVLGRHPNNNRPAKGPVFDPSLEGKPKMEGGKVCNLLVTPLVGIDREGNLYGKMNTWSGPTIDIKGKGYLSTRVYKIRRVQ